MSTHGLIMLLQGGDKGGILLIEVPQGVTLDPRFSHHQRRGTSTGLVDSIWIPKRLRLELQATELQNPAAEKPGDPKELGEAELSAVPHRMLIDPPTDIKEGGVAHIITNTASSVELTDHLNALGDEEQRGDWTMHLHPGCKQRGDGLGLPPLDGILELMKVSKMAFVMGKGAGKRIELGTFCSFEVKESGDIDGHGSSVAWRGAAVKGKKGPAFAGPIKTEVGLQQTDLLVVARRPIVDGQAGEILGGLSLDDVGKRSLRLL